MKAFAGSAEDGEDAGVLGLRKRYSGHESRNYFNTYCQGEEGKMCRDITVSPPPRILWLFGFVSFLHRKTWFLRC